MRWKYFVPTAVITALIVVFSVFFLDMALKSSIISVGEMAFGAKVEVSSLKTRFQDLSIDIKGLKAANKTDVYKNLFEIDNIRFSVRPLPLLSMKLIVNEMSVDGVKWGAARETSGALPPRKQAKYEKQQQKENKNGFISKLTDSVMAKSKSEISELPALGGIKNAQEQFKTISFDKVISKDDLQSVKEIESLKSSINEKSAKYQQQLKTLSSDDKIKEAAAQLADLGKVKLSTPRDAEALRSKLESLNKTKDALEKNLKDIQQIKAAAEADLGTDKELLGKLNELKDKDFKALSAKLKLPSFSTGSLAKSLFGPVWMGRVEKTLSYIQLVRKYMPPRKKSSKKITVQRSKGTDVSFPKDDNPPDFLIQKVALSGTTGGAGKEGSPLDFKGEINDITSDQAMLGRPTKFEVNGAKETKTLKVTGILDHTTDDATDAFTFAYAGLTAKEMNLPQSEYLPSFESGNGKIAGTFTLKGEDLDASVELNITGFKLPAAGNNDETKKLVASLWAGVDSISVSAKLTGKIDKINMSVSSNIDKVLGDRIMKLYGEKVAGMQNKVKAEIDRLTNEKKAELIAQFNANKNEITKMCDDKQKEARNKLDELNKMKDSKENEVKNLAGNAKKQAEEAVNAQKKQAEDKALAEKQKAEAQVEAEKKRVQDQLDAEKKKAEDEKRKAEDEAKKKAEAEAQKKAQEQLKGLFGR